MAWDGIERRSGRERRSGDRRSTISFSISMILNGEASRRSGAERRQYVRRAADRSKSKMVIDEAPKMGPKSFRAV